MEPDPMDRPVEPMRRSRLPLYAGLGGAGAVALLAAGLLVTGRDNAGSPARAPAMTETKAEMPAAPPLLAPRPLTKSEEPVPERLANAFEAVTGKRATYEVVEDGDIAIIRPVTVLALSFGSALVTEKHYRRQCDPCTDEI